MKYLSSTLLLLLFCIACTTIPKKEVKINKSTCISSNKENIGESDYLGGARGKENVMEGLAQLRKGAMFNAFNRNIRKNPNQGGTLIFNIYISGSGKVVDIETMHSDFEDCDFVNKVYRYYYELNFGEIENIHDISIFRQKLNFFVSPENFNQRFNSDSVPLSRGTSLINATR